ncbi:MAG: hypothetical protein LUG65_04600, partial [Clostridiales bacterium]|nr:hypothetical protein [Clostridiales bacterium]
FIHSPRLLVPFLPPRRAAGTAFFVETALAAADFDFFAVEDVFWADEPRDCVDFLVCVFFF